ncbi:MAG: threonine--tRNA ligase [bacterium]|nr:threonine--tRNA ligase [bacterium]
MKDKDYLYKLRHSAEHVLHQAVKELYPSIHLAMGPATDEGFYFDFDNSPEGKEAVTITDADFKNIEKRMWNIINKNLPITRHEISAKEAHKLFADNPYKQEWIEKAEVNKEVITIYWTGEPNAQGSMVDLCAGPHVDSTGEIKAFKLLSIAGAYWHGDEKNKMLTRIYGTAFESKEDLDKYLWQLEEAKKRDHRKLGKEMQLFVFSDLVGPGLPIYTPKGALVRRLLQEHVNVLQKEIGYKEVWTPQVTKADLFKTSGHYEKYKDDMFRVVSNYTDEEYFLKPMNCPNHCVLYASQSRSYRELPLRFSDFANLYRDEKPGELLGLSRLRAFSQDDGHCFCREDQVDEEFLNVAQIVKKAIEPFNMKYWIRLSLWDSNHPEKYLGDKEIWKSAQSKLKDILDKNNIEYTAVEGEAAIYGPKLDFIAIDALGREWQISTIQLDLIMPGRFGLTYTDQEGKEKTPLMIHRAILGSPERLMGLLIEHYAGAFPLWLAPEQVRIIPISERHVEAAQNIAKSLEDIGVRFELDDKALSMQKKIRNAQQSKVNYMLILGDVEVEKGEVNVRSRDGSTQNMSISMFLDKVKNEIESKK